ncbi:putative M23-family peptidase [Actinoplanes missouriensis 431]|uniref:Putative M23-family peptidase n=1 Tax=Actinoplanes missouriensis (strain ATCC 14538 / DSM 43046 / CBS 188.64 / JCM 3121 / NBRC 102363 / NCIMB 12654 / NRRL B-3342 / UNCC 431) TaxID=512565 RepID=I0H879_ACTM4|nr:M23 family metallopeptidase [Actinoplanes missouriensis]BAL89216.1 putative M23-family peptidase [Actinoplanes missouriensis 431]
MRYLKSLSGVAAVTVALTGFGGSGATVAAGPAPVEQIQVVQPVAMTPVAAAVKVKYAFPVKAKNVSFHKTHAGYPATDIFAACGKPFVATTSGVVLEVSRVDKYKKGMKDGPYNGGKFVSIKGDDGVRYYGSHLSSVSKGIKKGVRVKSGQQLGKVGKTGNASNVCHVHYGISPTCKKAGDWKVRRGVVWPAKYLTSWRKGGQKSPVAAVKAYQKKKGCKA